MLTNRALLHINSRPRQVGRLSLLAAGGGALILAALLYVFEVWSYFAVLGGGVPFVLLLYAAQKAKTTITNSPIRAIWARRQPPASPRCKKP